MYREVSKFLNPHFYEDVINKGGLENFLSLLLKELGSALHPDLIEKDLLPFPYASFSFENRQSQVMTASDSRLFSVDFWNNGVQYGSFWLEDLSILTESIYYFVEKKYNLFKMKKTYKWFKSDIGKIYEKGALYYTKYEWGNLFKFLKNEPKNSLIGNLFDAAKICYKISYLKSLLPFTSMNNLCFSKTTGYPFKKIDLEIISQVNKKFKIAINNSILSKEYNNKELFIFLKNNISDYGSAINGTADNT